MGQTTTLRIQAAVGAALTLGLLCCGLLRTSAATPTPEPPIIAAAPTIAAFASTPTATFAAPTFTATRMQSSPATSTPAPTFTPTILPSELTALDATWNRYTNRRLGFSLKVPKQAAYLYGGCAYSEKNGDHSWRPQEQMVPIRIFEDTDSIYIAFDYAYRLTGETKEGGRNYYYGCERQAVTLDALRAERRTWQIIVRPAKTDADVDAFIKQRFGAGCSLREVRPTAQEGVQEVRIQGDGKDMETTRCFVNYAVAIYYAAQKGKLYTCDLGQSCTFWASGSQSCYDDDMRESFRVE